MLPADDCKPPKWFDVNISSPLISFMPCTTLQKCKSSRNIQNWCKKARTVLEDLEQHQSIDKAIRENHVKTLLVQCSSLRFISTVLGSKLDMNAEESGKASLVWVQRTPREVRQHFAELFLPCISPNLFWFLSGSCLSPFRWTKIDADRRTKTGQYYMIYVKKNCPNISKLIVSSLLCANHTHHLKEHWAGISYWK